MKSPVLEGEELRNLGEAVHRDELVGCPRCSARLRVQLCPYGGKRSIDVFLPASAVGQRGATSPWMSGRADPTSNGSASTMSTSTVASRIAHMTGLGCWARKTRHSVLAP